MWSCIPLFVVIPAIAVIVATTSTSVSSFTTITKHLAKTSLTSRARTVTSLYMSSSSTVDTSTLKLFGHPGSRSPLINWACYELGFEITVASDLSKNPHPFGQLPCLTDKDAVIFESGAILLYLLQYYRSNVPSSSLSKGQLASIASWIVWANASLDPICFLETPNGKVYDTGLRQPNRRIDQLNTIVSNRSYLVRSADNNESVFTIADVAIVSYLAYVLQFFPDVTIADKWPAIASYMQNCIKRPTYGQAFTTTTQNRLLTVLEKDIATAAIDNGGNKDKKLFGMF